MDRPDWDERWRRERDERDEERARFGARDRDEEDRTRAARERYGVGERWGERDYPRFGTEHDRPSRSEGWGQSRGSASSRHYEEPYGSQQYIGYGNPLSSSYAGMGERMEGYSGGTHGRWGHEGAGRGGFGQESRSGREREHEHEGSVGEKVKRFFGMGPKGYKRSDQRIHEDVCDTLMEDGDVDASNIEVRVQNCEVMLSGTVEDRHQKRRAEDLAERVRGVSDVRNELRVSPRTESMGEGVRISGTTGSTGNGNRNRVS